MADTRQYWLMKSEPYVYSIDDLREEGSAEWEGVRNYQARNFMRDQMKVGDLALYYHSNSKPSGVVGISRICRESYPDDTQFDADSKYYDPKSTVENPRWIMVDVEFVEKFDRVVSIAELKAEADALDGMLVIKRGQRLSVQPVEEAHFSYVLRMAGSKTSTG